MSLAALALTLCICALAASPADAQDFRGAITGRITDAQGGRLPGATVTATHVATNVVSTTTTDSDGGYSFSVPRARRLQGHRRAVRLQESGARRRRGQDWRPSRACRSPSRSGNFEETVSVAAEAPLLDTRSGSAGQVIDEKRIALMPLSDGNPFVLARLAPGVAYHGDLKFSRPFDNGGTSDFTADGGPGRNEFTLDGSPNMANGRRVAFVPPAGAVQEFKVETATFDAQQGHTAGATVNVTLKSGTNTVPRRRLLPLPRRGAVRQRLLPRARRPAQGRHWLQALRLHGRRAGGARQALRRPRQDVLLHRLRVALRHVPRAWPVHGADRRPAQRRLLGAALAGHHHLRSARRRCSRADGRVERQPFAGNIIPSQPHQPDRAQLHGLLPDAQPGGRRAGPQQLHHRQFARRRFLLDELPRRPRPDRTSSASSSATRATTASRTAATGPATSKASSRPAISCSASTTRSTSITSGRCRTRRC